ncbi:hypothetical protein ONZ45_g3072 [Pleurotus djamor]|nr:hypothetical protein ONZ45_g3072 [Pleurotus djamor]
MTSRFNFFSRNNAEPNNGPAHHELPQPMPYTSGVPGYYIPDEALPRSHSTPPTTTNNNIGPGVLNNVNGTQNNNNKTDVWEGDHYTGTITGGNVGGRGNTNTIHNNGGPLQGTVPPLVHTATAPAALPRGAPPVLRGDYKIFGMEMDLYTIEKEIEEYMSSLGWDEYRKVEKRIKAARLIREELREELRSL